MHCHRNLTVICDSCFVPRYVIPAKAGTHRSAAENIGVFRCRAGGGYSAAGRDQHYFHYAGNRPAASSGRRLLRDQGADPGAAGDHQPDELEPGLFGAAFRTHAA